MSRGGASPRGDEASASVRELTGRVAAVTGGGSGIGRALCAALADARMLVAVVDTDVPAAELVAAHIRSRGGQARALAADVRDEGSLSALADVITADLGPVNVLCNNAGILRPGTTWEQTQEDWDAVFAVNVFGVLNGLRVFVPRMLAHGQPAHVVNIASVGGMIPAPYLASYIASKYAVVAITESMALELDGSNIGVTVACPGATVSNIYRREVERRGGERSPSSSAAADHFARLAAPDRPDQGPSELVADRVVAAIRAGDRYCFACSDADERAIRARWDDIDVALRSRLP